MLFSKEFRTGFAITFQRRVLLVPYMLLLCPVWGPFAIWAIADRESDTAVKGLTGALFCCGVASWVWAHFAGYYMAVEFQSFRSATWRALVPLLVRLAFVPIIGPAIKTLVARSENAKSKRFVRRDPFARDEDE